MYRAVRKKVAESVSKLESPEHYDWNRWLREPDADEYYIDNIYTLVLDTSALNVWPELPSTGGYTFDLPKVKYSKPFKQLYIQKQKTSKIFFSFPKPSINEIKEILKKADIAYSLSVSESGKGAIFRLSEGKSKKVFEPSTEIFIREFYLLSPRLFNLPMLVSGQKVYSVSIGLKDKVKVLDLLSNLKPEVMNVELLNSAHFIDPLNAAENRKVEFQPLPKSSHVEKIEVMQLEKLLGSINDQKKLIRKVSFNAISSDGIPADIKIPSALKNKLKILSVKNIRISPPKIKQGVKITNEILSEIKGFTFSSRQDVIDESKDVLSRDLEVILQPAINFSKEEKSRIYDFLYDYQKPSADFLSEKEMALLNDELGTGKTLEAIGALKILFRRKDISNAVIVCRKEDIGWPKRSKLLSSTKLCGWYDHLLEFAPSITACIIHDNTEHEWKSSSAVKIIDHNLFSEALEKKLISLDELNRRSCLILDEVEDFPEFTLEPRPKYLWMLSGLPAEGLKDKLAQVTGTEVPVDSFGRTRQEISGSLPKMAKQDYWIEMDPDQRLEYEKALEAGREKIYDLVQAGNPFLVQSNVFTLIHQLTQIGNFHGKKELSVKSELLIHHVKSIKNSGKKVMIYSQYDRQGTQRLEKLFAKNGIKYVLYQTGITLKEMEDAVKKFAKDKSITVFLAGMKALNAKLNLENVPYLIHFDQWWSPVTTWQTEEKLYSSESDTAGSLHIYNYFIKNSIDEKIQMKLVEKGLDNRNLFDLLSSEGMYSLFTNEDWLEVLELIEPKDTASIEAMKNEHLDYITQLTTDDFSHKVKALLGRIGYKNVSFKTAFNSDEIRLYASSVKNSLEVKAAVQCLNTKVVTKKAVKEFTESLVSKTEKIFIFTTGDFDEKLVKNPGDDRIVLISKHQASEYFYMLNLI